MSFFCLLVVGLASTGFPTDSDSDRANDKADEEWRVKDVDWSPVRPKKSKGRVGLYERAKEAVKDGGGA